MSRITVDVVVHTHWDREWYLPRETTLMRLQVLMQQVLGQLEEGRLQSFLFDGQTAALQDLLAVAEPALAARVRQAAAAGRLVLGPWFVSADEFLVSGESLLRNLEIGHQDAQAVGRAQRVGYLPDTFGHVAQMPQILAQWGITHAVVWRGADALHDRFDWVAPDGTQAHTVFLTQGYYLHPLHGPAWASDLPALLQRMAARRAPGDHGPLLLTHGGDHLAPSPELTARLRTFNAEQNDFELRESTLEQHVMQHVVQLGPVQNLHGELRHNVQAFVLPDVLSTRRYLKLAHQQAEDRLLARHAARLAAVDRTTSP
jgi:mannosylglycerate hydrolase